MRKFLILLFIFSNTVAFSQKDLTKNIEDMQKSIAEQRARLDSSRKATDSFLMRQMKRNDSIEIARQMEQNGRNLDGLLRTMKEREEKQKKAMWMRLIFGGALLGVGIFAMLRKRKKKDIQ